MKEEALDGNGREEGEAGGGGGGAEVLSEEVVAQVLEMFDETYEDAFFKVRKCYRLCHECQRHLLFDSCGMTPAACPMFTTPRRTSSSTSGFIFTSAAGRSPKSS